MDIKCLGNPKKRYTTCRFWTNHKCKKHPDFCNYVHSYVCPDKDQCERFDCTLLHFNQARKIVLHRRKVTEHAASKKPRAVQRVREHRTNLPGANNTSVFKWSAISPNWRFNNSALKDNSASETNSPSFDDFDEDLCEGLEEVGQELDRFAEEVSESSHCEDEVICLTEQENNYSKHSSPSTTCYNKNLLNRKTVSEAPIELKRNPTKVASKVEILCQAKELAHKGKNTVSKEVKKGLQCVMGLKTRNESMQIIKPHRRDVLQLEEENKHATSHTMLKMPLLVTDSHVQNGPSTSLGSSPIVDLNVPAIVVTGSLSITNTHPKQTNFLVQSSSSHTSKICLADNSLHNVNSRIINGTVSRTSAVDKTVSRTSAVDKTVSHTSAVDKTVSHTSAVDKTVSRTSAVDKTVSCTSAVDKTVSRTSAVDKTVSRTSAVDKTVSRTSAVDKTVSRTSAVDKTVSRTSAVDKTDSRTSAVAKTVSRTSAVDKTVSRTSAVDKTVSHTSAVDKTVSHTSAVDKTVSHKSAMTGAGSRTSAVDKRVSHTLAVNEAVSHASAVDKTVSHTSAVNEAVSHTSAVDKTASHTSAVNGAGSHTSAVDKTVSHTSAMNGAGSHASAVDKVSHTSTVDKTVSHTSAVNGAVSHISAVNRTVSHTSAVDEIIFHPSAVDETIFHPSAVDGVVSHPSVVGRAVSHPSAVDGAVSCLSAVDIKEATNSGYKNNLSPKKSKIIDKPSKALQEVKHSDTNVKLDTRNSSNDCLSQGSGLVFKEGWPVSFSNSSQPINQSENSTLGETGEDKLYELTALLSQKKQLVNKIKSLVKQKKNLSLQRDYVMSNCSGDTTKLSQIFEENSQITKKISDKILICNAQIKLTNQKINDLENSKSFKTTTGILLKEDDTNKEQVIGLGCFISSNEQVQNYEEYFNQENLSNKDKMFEKRYSESQELSRKEEKLVNVHHKDVNSPTEELLKGSHEIQTPQMPKLEGKKEALQQNNQDGKWVQVPSIQQKQNVNKVSNIMRSDEKTQSQHAPHMPELEGKKEALQQNNQDGKWLPVHILQYNKADNSICNIASSSRNITSQQEQCQQTQFPGSVQENYIVHDEPVSKDGNKCDESSHHKGKMPDSSKDLSTHWCRVCNMFFTHVYGYVKHLESSSHMGKIKDESRETWMQKIPQYKNKNHSEIIQGNPDTVGAEFLHSTTIFFCELCESIFWNTQDAALHPQSTIHAQKYKEHVQKNTNQERCFLTAKMNAFTEYFKERKAKSQKNPTKEITKGIIAEDVNKQSEDGTKERNVLHKSESLLSYQSDGLSNKRKALSRKGYNKRTKFARENQNTNSWY